MVIEKDLDFSTEGLDVHSVKVILKDEHIDKINKARKVLEQEENDFISSINILAWDVDVKQFDSTLDDDERKEMEYDDVFYFRWDTGILKVYKGTTYFIAYGKYDSSYYFEVELDI